MTLNCGHKITLAFTVFVLLMGTLVYKSLKTDFQLVTKDYYKDELAYQQVIDGSNRANRLSSKVQVAQLNNELIVQLPAEMNGKTITGNIWLYCSSDDTKDRRLELSVDKTGKQVIDGKQILPANYLFKITWKADELNYYNEQQLELK
jgi:hypothetical protein